MFIKKNWWKVLSVIMILYSLSYGLINKVPNLPNIRESIRNLYYHVPMWFTMMTLFSVAVVYSILYLSSQKKKYDIIAKNFVIAGIFFGFLGLISGMIWAKYTWGEAWSGDPKQMGAALSILSYLAYIVLRASITDEEKRAKIAAVYNIFAFAMMIPFIWILPSMTDSLHPGSGGNTGFNTYDLDNEMRTVFYPAIIGWILLGVWMTSILTKMDEIKNQLLYNETN